MFFGRGKNKKQNPYTFTDMYKDYISDKKEGDIYHVDYNTYRELCEEYYKEITDRLLSGKFIKVGNSIGIFHVYKTMKKATDRLCIDWKSTNYYHKRIYHTNEHSRKYSYKLYWDKTLCHLPHIRLYSFTFCRAAKRKLAKFIKEQKYDYFEKK